MTNSKRVDKLISMVCAMGITDISNIAQHTITDQREVIELELNSDKCGTKSCVMHARIGLPSCFDYDTDENNPLTIFDKSFKRRFFQSEKENINIMNIPHSSIIHLNTYALHTGTLEQYKVVNNIQLIQSNLFLLEYSMIPHRPEIYPYSNESIDNSIMIYIGNSGAGKSYNALRFLYHKAVTIIAPECNLDSLDKTYKCTNLIRASQRLQIFNKLNGEFLVKDVIFDTELNCINTEGIILIDDAHKFNIGILTQVICQHNGTCVITYATDQHGEMSRFKTLLHLLNSYGFNNRIKVHHAPHGRSLTFNKSTTDKCGTISCLLHRSGSGTLCYNADSLYSSTLDPLGPNRIFKALTSTIEDQEVTNIIKTIIKNFRNDEFNAKNMLKKIKYQIDDHYTIQQYCQRLNIIYEVINGDFKINNKIRVVKESVLNNCILLSNKDKNAKLFQTRKSILQPFKNRVTIYGISDNNIHNLQCKLKHAISKCLNEGEDIIYSVNEYILTSNIEVNVDMCVKRAYQRRRSIMGYDAGYYVNDILTPTEIMGMSIDRPMVIINAQRLLVKEVQEIINRCNKQVFIVYLNDDIGPNERLIEMCKVKLAEVHLCISNNSHFIPISTVECGWVNCSSHTNYNGMGICFDEDIGPSSPLRQLDKNKLLTQMNISKSSRTSSIINSFLSAFTSKKIEVPLVEYNETLNLEFANIQFETKSENYDFVNCINTLGYKKINVANSVISATKNLVIGNNNSGKTTHIINSLGEKPFTIIVPFTTETVTTSAITEDNILRAYQRRQCIDYLPDHMNIYDTLNLNELSYINNEIAIYIQCGNLVPCQLLINIINNCKNDIYVEFTTFNIMHDKIIQIIYDKCRDIKVTSLKAGKDKVIVNDFVHPDECYHKQCAIHSNCVETSCYINGWVNSNLLDLKNPMSIKSLTEIVDVVSNTIGYIYNVVSVITAPLTGIYTIPNSLLSLAHQARIYSYKLSKNLIKPIEYNNEPILRQHVSTSNRYNIALGKYDKYFTPSNILVDNLAWCGITGSGKTHSAMELLKGLSIVYITPNIIKVKSDAKFSTGNNIRLKNRIRTIDHFKKFDVNFIDILEYRELSGRHFKDIVLLDDVHLIDSGILMDTYRRCEGPVFMTYGEGQQGDRNRFYDLIKLLNTYKPIKPIIIEYENSYTKRKAIEITINSDACGTKMCQIHNTPSGVMCYDNDVRSSNKLRTMDKNLTYYLQLSDMIVTSVSIPITIIKRMADFE